MRFEPTSMSCYDIRGGHWNMQSSIQHSSEATMFSQLHCFNTRLALGCLLIAVSSFNYGFDNQAFATTQAMDAFDKHFGVWNPMSQSWVLESYWLSLFNSLNYIGFAFGRLFNCRTRET